MLISLKDSKEGSEIGMCIKLNGRTCMKRTSEEKIQNTKENNHNKSTRMKFKHYLINDNNNYNFNNKK